MTDYKLTKKRLASLLCAAVILFTGLSAASESEFRVRLNCLTGNESFIADMGETPPVNVRDRTLVPLRTICEAAGFKVGWDQNLQTVYIKLFADSASDKPIERYCYELMSSTRAASLDIKPEYIYLEMPVNNLNFAVKYCYTDFDGENIVYGKTADTEIPATFGEYGTLMIPLRSVMEAFSLAVGWDAAENLSSVTIPAESQAPEDMYLLPADYSVPANYTTLYAELVRDILTPEEQPSQQPAGLPSNIMLGECLGSFKITHYCPCAICNGTENSNTAWAGKIIPGQTIAVDPAVIGKLQWVYVEGYGLRRAEDCGGAIKGNKIDMAVATHSLALSMGVAYKNVYAVSFGN